MRPVRAALAAILASAIAPATLAGSVTTTFENLGVASNSYVDDAGPSGRFLIDGNAYNNSYNPTYGAWSGWSLSTMTDTTDPNYTNQFSAITGSGAGGSSTYAVGFTFGGSADPFHPSGTTITLGAGMTPDSIQITNTTYAYLTMRDGDPYGFSQPFTRGDYQLLDIRGYDANGNLVGTVDFYLANFLSSNKADWYIVDTWRTVDLSSLAGSAVLKFGIQSSQNDPTYGVNTPTYFAADNFTFHTETVAAVPEPAGVLMLGLGMVGLVGLKARRRLAALLPCVLLAASAVEARAGSFDPQVGQAGSLGIARSSPLFQEWASSVISFNRGPQDISNPSSPLASAGQPSNALGSAGGVVSLGDGGSITLGFDTPITNGAGADFAVFENGFLSGSNGLAFLELAFVDVSSDGIHFFRFPSISETQTDTQVGGFGSLDASNLHNLAGKYIGGYGTGFDLSDLAGMSPYLDINHVTQVRITDVVGSIDPRYGSRDSEGHLINDPFTTPFASSGFDLTGVGVIHMAAAVPEPTGLALALTAMGIIAAPAARRAASRRAGRASA